MVMRILISRFISLIFLSTSVALNILSLYQLFCDFENFMSLFGHFQSWAPICFPKIICLRYDPANISSLLQKCHFPIDAVLNSLANTKGL